MTKHLVLIAFTLLSIMLKSQTLPSVPTALEAFKTTAGSQNLFGKSATKTDRSGNIYTCGLTVNGAGDYDAFLVKFSPSGHLLWQKQIPGVIGGMDFATNLVIGSTYIILTGGITTSTATPTTDIFTTKLDASTGATTWIAYYNGTGSSFDSGKHVVLDASDNVYVTGASYNTTNTDFITIKYTSTGSQSWVNRWDYLGLDDAAIKVIVSGANLTVTGAVTTATVNTYKFATLTLAQSTGSLLATSVGTAVTTTSINAVMDAASDPAGNIILIGSNNVTGQGTNFYVQNVSPATLVSAWTYTWNGTSSLDDIAAAVAVDPVTGDVYVSGYSTTSGTNARDLTLIKLNSSGVQQWVKNSSFSGNDEAADMVIDASSNVYLTGYKTTAGTKNYYTVKYSTAGTKMWEVEMDNGFNDNATNIAIDTSNNVICAGQTEVAAGVYVYTTVKYAQKDVITPADFNGEAPNTNFRYYSNRGQLIGTNHILVPEVKYYTYNNNPSFYFKRNSQSFAFLKADTSATAMDTLQRIDLTFASSNESAETYALEKKSDYYLNYFLAHTDTTGVRNVFGNQRLITSNLYNNIDLMCSSDKGGIKYYFIVKPGGDMRNIQMEFTGAASFSLNGTTNALTVNSSIGSITYAKPIAYQLTAANATVAVTGFTPDWQTNGATNKYKFNTGTYTSSLTLIIMVGHTSAPLSPVNASAGNLNYSTYYGSTGIDQLSDIKVDSKFRYIVGYTANAAFPAQGGLFTYNGGNEGVLLKYTLNSDSLRFATFYGGTGNDAINAIAVTKAGDIYLGGTTTSNDLLLPNTKPGASLQPTNPQGGNLVSGFLAEFSNLGNAVKWSRYVAGSYTDNLNGIALDTLDNLYVCGTTGSQDFPTTSTAYKSTLQGQYDKNQNMFVMKFNSGSVVQWSTYFGGTLSIPTSTSVNYGKDGAIGLTVDNQGNVYVVGVARTMDFPVIFPGTPTANSVHYTTRHYTTDGAIVKFNSGGTPVWSSYFGGDFDDQINDIKLTSTNDMIIVGNSNSRDTTIFPVKRKAGAFNFIRNYSGDRAFFSKIGSNYDNLWTTFYAKQSNTLMFVPKLTVVNDGFIVTGTTTNDSINLPVSSPYPAYSKPTKSPSTNMGFLAYFDSNQSLVHAHYFGGDYLGGSALKSVTSDKNNAIYFVGYGYGNYPIAYTSADATLIDSTYSGGAQDGVITRLMLGPLALSVQDFSKAGINNSINAYPNPVFNEFFINLSDLKETKNYSGAVYNMQGQIITTFTNTDFNSDILKINCTNWSNGMYIVSITTDTAKYTAKIVKQ